MPFAGAHGGLAASERSWITRLGLPEARLLRGREPIELLVAVQLGLIAAAAIGVAFGLPLWGVTDENAHVSYVAAVGAGHLPLLGHFAIQPDIAGLVYHASSFGNQSYEAFQPPLYYLVMAIPWDVAKAVGGARAAVDVLRLLDVLLLAVAVRLLWALARRVAPSRETALVAFAFALTYVLWPGVVFRNVTVSNVTLEVPLTTAALLAMWVAFDEGSARALILAGGLCGLGWLCRLPFPVVVMLPLVAWRFRRSAPLAALVAVALPVVLISPWLIDNVSRYHALTAAATVHKMQDAFFNPGGRPYGLSRMLHDSKNMLTGLLPDEWQNAATTFGGHALSDRLLHVIRVAGVAWVLVPLGLWLWRGPRRVWLLVVPLILGVALLYVETAAERLFLISPRYVYPLLPPFGLGCGLALARLRRAGDEDAGAHGRQVVAPTVVAGLTAGLIALWLYLVIAVPPFVNSGVRIH
jgi:Dolichyl-phosphate-mannose-protein mannosyltransferase